jgi:DNA mismatch repair protein MutL
VLQALRASNLVPEVRFRDEHAPQSFERLRLGPGADYRPTTTYVNEETGEIIERVADRPYQSPHERPAASPLYASAFDALFYSEDEVRMQRAAADAQTDAQTEAQTQSIAGSQGPIWQLHNKYIFVQTPEGMIVVDQHIAHERILYERALAAMSNGIPYSQRLLFPVNVSMSVSERSALNEVREEIRELGYELETSGTDVRVVSVPLDVRSGEESSALIEILEQFNEYKQVRAAESRDNLAASFACRASIKAGDPLSVAEMRKLVHDLFATAVPEVCPHGRPVLVRFDLKEFDRRFGRTS